MKTGKLLLGIGAAAVVAYALSTQSNIKKKRTDLVNWMEAAPAGEIDPAEQQRYIDIFVNRMNAAEIEATHKYIFDFALAEQPLTIENPLYNTMQAIVNKYNIFNG